MAFWIVNYVNAWGPQKSPRHNATLFLHVLNSMGEYDEFWHTAYVALVFYKDFLGWCSSFARRR